MRFHYFRLLYPDADRHVIVAAACGRPLPPGTILTPDGRVAGGVSGPVSGLGDVTRDMATVKGAGKGRKRAAEDVSAKAKESQPNALKAKGKSGRQATTTAPAKDATHAVTTATPQLARASSAITAATRSTSTSASASASASAAASAPGACTPAAAQRARALSTPAEASLAAIHRLARSAERLAQLARERVPSRGLSVAPGAGDGSATPAPAPDGSAMAALRARATSLALPRDTVSGSGSGSGSGSKKKRVYKRKVVEMSLDEELELSRADKKGSKRVKGHELATEQANGRTGSGASGEGVSGVAADHGGPKGKGKKKRRISDPFGVTEINIPAASSVGVLASTNKTAKAKKSRVGATAPPAVAAPSHASSTSAGYETGPGAPLAGAGPILMPTAIQHPAPTAPSASALPRYIDPSVLLSRPRPQSKAHLAARTPSALSLGGAPVGDGTDSEYDELETPPPHVLLRRMMGAKGRLGMGGGNAVVADAEGTPTMRKAKRGSGLAERKKKAGLPTWATQTPV